MLINMVSKGRFLWTILLFSGLFNIHIGAMAQEVRWADYMDYKEMTNYLKKWTSNNSELTSLSSIGKSYEGRELWLVTVTNSKKGAAQDKPALYVQGGIDSDEVISTQSAMYLLNKLLTKYGADENITKLVDSYTLYLLPNLIPDQSERYHHLPANVRDSTTRPYDNDNDGLVDEDDQDDIDGDGRVLNMRVKNPLGRYQLSKTDPRVMVARDPLALNNNGPFYDFYPREGIDNDKDGLINEDPLGGIDPNRNWPAHWKQEYIQDWAGPYPLSEIETRSLAEFYLNHPNIGMIIDLHSTGNILYRPSSVYTDEMMDLQDLNHYQVMGKLYTNVTNGAVWTPLSKRQAAGKRGIYGNGIMIDWAYQHLGVFSFAPELWNFPFDKNNKTRNNATESEKIDWALKNFGPKVWTDWYEVEHPDLGTVELGGWNKPMPNNPMGKYVERVADEITTWMLQVWQKLPYLAVDTNVKALKKNQYKIIVKISNTGYMPTNVTNRALTTEMVKPIFLTVESSGASVLAMTGAESGHLYGSSGLVLGQLDGWKDTKVTQANRKEGGRNVKFIELIVEKTNKNSKVEIKVNGQRAGIVRKVVAL
ncbi:M14 family metallopeptidase [Colwellia sp. RE-S-Sl-9]